MRLVWMALAAARLVAAGDFALGFSAPGHQGRDRAAGACAHGIVAVSGAGASAQKLSEDWLKLVAITGFDPLHDIDEVLLTSAADQENAPALLVVRGRFNLERMGAGAQRYHGVAMVGDGKDGHERSGLLDATTALAGDAPVVKAAIDRRGQAAARWRRTGGARGIAARALRPVGDGRASGGLRGADRQERATRLDRPLRIRDTDHQRASSWARRCMRGRRRMRRSWRHRWRCCR